MGKTTTDTITARQRAREARAKLTADRAARDRRIEDATTDAYTAMDWRANAAAEVLAAEVKLGKALAALRDEGEPVANVATLTGLSDAEVRRLTPAAVKKSTDKPVPIVAESVGSLAS